MDNKNQQYTTGSVTSKDGTKIGYRQMGSGRGIVLLHGGVNASQHLMGLGTVLSGEFTVYIPDRRGRGMSGSVGNNYSIEREDEDINTLLKKTGAHYVFGTADGALFALHAAIFNRDIHKGAAYEPLVFAGQQGLDQFKAMIHHFDKDISNDNVAAATVHLTKDSVKLFRFIPDFIAIAIVKLVLWINARNVKGDDVAYKDLIPTLRDELHLVEKTEGTLEEYKDVSAEVLLLGGSKTESLLKNSLSALDNVLPNSRFVEIPGLNHDSAQDYGKPKIIAHELLRFFRD
jgi:pimeloyl-ACP methyl ester carboxylesterase